MCTYSVLHMIRHICMQICDKRCIMAAYMWTRESTHHTHSSIRPLHTCRDSSLPMCGRTQVLGPATLYTTANWVGLPLCETAQRSLLVFLELGHHRALVPSLLLPIHQETLSPNWPLPRSGFSRRESPVHTGPCPCPRTLLQTSHTQSRI